ncbi:hypothetical protein [Rufibacter roseus]|uniref:Uncharacterized protein n=1 Tax=Rufibacter roseus TaxID=1567108 RepID=A0ABW2DR91_9BACT|nr:hypothetical protein [Rufibacter roseus]
MKTQREIAEEWMGFVLQGWKKQLSKLNIGNTQELMESFAGDVLAAANGDVQKIKLLYVWYGQMVDIGVGRGSKLGDQKDNATSRRIIGKTRGNSRRPKRWYSKGRDSIGAQVNKLSYLLAEQASLQGSEQIAGSIQKQLVINI